MIKALEEHNVTAVASLIALLALQNPERAETIRQTLLSALLTGQGVEQK